MAAAYSLGDRVPRRVRWISEPWTWHGQSGSTNKEAKCSSCPGCGRNFISHARNTTAIGKPGQHQWKQQAHCNDCLPEYLRRQKNARQKRYRDRHRAERQATCQHCSASFTPQRSTARFCSAACRAAAHRGRLPPVTAAELLQLEFMEPLGLDSAALAAAINVPTAQIEAVLQGQQLIDAVLDRRLCQQWGLSSGYWLRAQQLSP